MSFPALLDNQVDIKRDIESRDGIGHTSIVATVLYTNVPCRFESVDKRLEMVVYDKKTTYPEYWVYMEFLSGIREGDYIEKDGRKFSIKHTRDWSEQNQLAKLGVVEIGRDE